MSAFLLVYCIAILANSKLISYETVIFCVFSGLAISILLFKQIAARLPFLAVVAIFLVYEYYLWEQNENFFSQALVFLKFGLVLVATQWLFWLDKDTIASMETNISLEQAVDEVKAIFSENKPSRSRVLLSVAAIFLFGIVNVSYDFRNLKSTILKTIDEQYISKIQFLPDNYETNIKLPLGFIYSNDTTAKIYLESGKKIAVLEYQVSSLSSFLKYSLSFSEEEYEYFIDPNKSKNRSSLLTLGLQ